MPAALAIIGGETLLGKELRELSEGLPFPVETTLLDTELAAEGIRLTESGGEPSVVQSLTEINLGKNDVVFLAGSEASSRWAAELAAKLHSPPTLIDVTHALEDNPATRLRAPEIEMPVDIEPTGVYQIAHPAAIAAASLLRSLAGSPGITRSVFHIFEPASERGLAGIEELQQQTAGLLSFKPLVKKVFDAQVSFNMLARYGDDAPVPLSSIEERIAAHLATLAARIGNVPMPSLRLVQPPVFHGYSISAWVQFEKRLSISQVYTRLSEHDLDVRGADLEPPNNVGVASQGGVAVGGVAPDRSDPNAVWFWIAADNLRLTAENAILVARPFLQAGGRE